MNQEAEQLNKLKCYARSEEKKIRKQAAVELGKLDTPEAHTLLVELTEDEDISVRYFAKRALKQYEMTLEKPGETIDPDKIEPDIFMKTKLTQLYSPKKSERIKASRIIEEIGDKSVLPEIKEILSREKDHVIISNLISIIGKLGGDEELELLKTFLNAEADSRVRANAVEAIGNIRQDSEVFKIIAPFIKDKNPRVVGNCAKILWNYSKEKTLLLLKNMLESDNKDFVWSAMYACGELPSLETRALILTVFKNPDLNYQLKAAKTLKKIDDSLFDDISVLLLKKSESLNLQIDPSVFKYLTDILLNQPEEDQIIAASILYLIAQNDDRNIEINIKEMLQDQNLSEKLLATLVKLLAKVCGNKELVLLLSFLESKNERVVANTIDAMEYIDDPRMVQILFSYLDHENLRIRGNAIKILKKSFRTNLRDKIEELLKSSKEVENKVALHIIDEVGTEEDLPLLTISTANYQGDLLISRNRLISKIKKKAENLKMIQQNMSIENLKRALSKAFDMLTDPDFMVRKQGLEFLKSNSNLSTMDCFIERLKHEKNPYLIATYLKLIGACRKEEVFSVIEPYLSHNECRVRGNAVEALFEIESPAILPAVTPMLNDPDLRVRKNAAFLVWKLSDTREVKKLRNLLDTVESALKTTANIVLSEDIELDKKISSRLDEKPDDTGQKLKFILAGSTIFIVILLITFLYSVSYIMKKFDSKISQNDAMMVSKIQQIVEKKIDAIEKQISSNKSLSEEQLESLKKSLRFSKAELEKMVLNVQKKPVKTTDPDTQVKKPDQIDAMTLSERKVLEKLVGYTSEIKKLVAEKDFNTARALIEEAGKLKSDYTPILFQQGLILYDESNYDGALKLFNTCVLKEPENADYLFYIADTYKQLGKPQSAYNYYEKLMVVDPANANHYMEAAKILLNSGDYEKANGFFTSASKLDRNLVEARIYSGICYFNLGNMEAANTIFTELKDKELGKEIPFVYLGQIYLKDSLFEEAGKMFRQALGINPASEDALLGLSRISFRVNDMDQARGYIEKILINRPKDINALMLLAKINKTMVMDDEAIKILTRVISYNNYELEAYDLMIELLLKKKKYQEAAEYMTLYLSVIPDSDAVRRDNVERQLFETEKRLNLDTTKPKTTPQDPNKKVIKRR